MWREQGDSRRNPSPWTSQGNLHNGGRHFHMSLASPANELKFKPEQLRDFKHGQRLSTWVLALLLRAACLQANHFTPESHFLVLEIKDTNLSATRLSMLPWESKAANRYERVLSPREHHKNVKHCRRGWVDLNSILSFSETWLRVGAASAPPGDFTTGLRS